MVETDKIFKKGATLKVVKINPNNKRVIALINACKKQQADLKKLQQFDAEQLKSVITI